ncbi:CHAT domain-containing protein [Micromonospora saelicesensis]|uniref:CHAT domain-containing protein n=1 Tax=Micromonospora saelicesensis TaxID=285676 RepID=A0A1C4Z3B6_9ACTN|nr:CHAT domain-containing protein [Micromonospora saelicesensis]SCF27397.1 CHAT domain-containing protein [Micromonospora saelicesensis]
MDPDHLNRVFNQLLAVTDPAGIRSLLEQNPEVLTDEVEGALAATIESLTAAGDTEVLPAAGWIARLIAYCRIVGVDRFTRALAAGDRPDADDLFPSAQEALNGYQATRDPDLLDTLADLVAYAYTIEPPGPLQALFSDAMGVGWRRHFLTTGDEADLVRAVRALRLAVADAGESSPARGTHLSNLGNVLRTAASAGGSPELLAESAEAQRTALAAVSGEESHAVAANLGASLIELFARTGDHAALDEAVEVLTSARNGSPARSQVGRLIRSNLALALSHRYDLASDVDDLSAAVDAAEAALAGQPADDAGATREHIQLATDLRRRYLVLGADADIERAISLLRARFARGSLEAGFELATALEVRFRQTGNREDLHEGRALREAAVAATAAEPRASAQALNNLGLAYRNEFDHSDRRGPAADLITRAIDCFEDALAALSEQGEPVYPVQGNLAMALLMRYERTGDRRDLDRAVGLEEMALAATPPGSHDHGVRLAELASALRATSGADESAESASRAVTLMEEAVRVIGGSPVRFGVMHNLALALLERHRRTGDTADFDRAAELLLVSVTDATRLSPRVAVQSGMVLGGQLRERDRWADASHAYALAMTAARRLVETQLRWDDANSTIRMLGLLPQLAAYTHARTGNARAAVATIERGRAYLLNSMLDRRLADLRDLDAAGQDTLAEEYRRAVDHLRFLETATADHPTVAPDRAGLIGEIRAARHAFAEVVGRVRAVPGFERFADETGDHDEAAPMPVVYLVAAEPGGVALIRRPGQTAGESLIIDCPRLGFVDVLGQVQTFLARPASAADDSGAWARILDELTRRLWEIAMGAVIAALTPGERVVLIPVGLLSLLPWHAAWRPDATRDRVYALDELRISYAPTARVLAENAPSAGLGSEPATLIVEQPAPVDAPPLPLAGVEAGGVGARFARVTRRRGEGATRETVLDDLGRHEVAHLICHGSVALEHPLDTFLLMAGDIPMTMRDVLSRPHDGLHLVVLSACDTGSYWFDNPTEVFSLASAFLGGGVSEVIASLWPVPDTSTTLLMNAVYRLWRDDGESPADALRLGQQWLRESTNEEKFEACPDAFGAAVRALAPAARRVWGRARAHRSPLHWAAFAHHGWAG